MSMKKLKDNDIYNSLQKNKKNLIKISLLFVLLGVSINAFAWLSSNNTVTVDTEADVSSWIVRFTDKDNTEIKEGSLLASFFIFIFADTYVLPVLQYPCSLHLLFGRSSCSAEHSDWEFPRQWSERQTLWSHQIHNNPDQGQNPYRKHSYLFHHRQSSYN